MMVVYKHGCLWLVVPNPKWRTGWEVVDVVELWRG